MYIQQGVYYTTAYNPTQKHKMQLNPQELVLLFNMMQWFGVFFKEKWQLEPKLLYNEARKFFDWTRSKWLSKKFYNFRMISNLQIQEKKTLFYSFKYTLWQDFRPVFFHQTTFTRLILRCTDFTVFCWHRDCNALPTLLSVKITAANAQSILLSECITNVLILLLFVRLGDPG